MRLKKKINIKMEEYELLKLLYYVDIVMLIIPIIGKYLGDRAKYFKLCLI